MYVIYRIVCFATGAVYIGQSCNPKSRRHDHFSTLKRGKHHNKHLQHAYDKYGKGSFYFEVIERDIAASDIDDRERYWIEYFDSYHNGFNSDLGGQKEKMSMGIPCTWNGIHYVSITAAARACGITLVPMKKRLKKGYVCDGDLVNSHKIPCIWNGIEYSCLQAAATARGVVKQTMWKQFLQGYTCDADVRYRPRRKK